MKNDGGPAYPGIVRDNSGILETVQGVTVRDLFAITILQGLLSCAMRIEIDGLKIDTKSETYINMSYDLADKMIAAREN